MLGVVTVASLKRAAAFFEDDQSKLHHVSVTVLQHVCSLVRQGHVTHIAGSLELNDGKPTSLSEALG